MAATSALPNGDHADEKDNRLPDCIIASSNRFDDFGPFCDDHFHENPKIFAQILPWEFPQDADRETEESFLRKFFTETEIHMQGGAHGVGAGFRFLKQAWYIMAIWNSDKRIPAIAQWWLNQPENASFLEDPDTQGQFFSAEAVPETFFSPPFIEEHGKKILVRVVRKIQELAQSKLGEQTEAAKSVESQRSSSNEAVMEPENPKNDSLPPALPSPMQEERESQPSTSTRGQAQVPPTSTAADATPFPTYREKRQGSHPSSYGERRDSSSSYQFLVQQVQGRKRGGRHGSTGSSRMSAYDRRQQEYQYNYAPNMYPTPTGYDPSLPYSNNPVPSPHRTMQAGQGSQAYSSYVTPTQNQQLFDPYVPVNQNFENSFPVRHQSGLHNKQPQMPYNFRQSGEVDRNTGDRSISFGFNNISNKSGDARRSSHGSRGGSVRGQSHGGRGRGSKGRESFHEHTPFLEQRPYVPNTQSYFHSKPTTGQNKRRGCAYQDNSWRSHSERPQGENSFPQRTFSGLDQFVTYPEFSGPTSSQLLPPFSFPPNRGVEQQNFTEQRPRPARDSTRRSESLAGKVGESYIGPNATHVTQLLVVDIPIRESAEDVAKRFSHDCAVEVVNVNLKPPPNPNAQCQFAFIDFPNHMVARQVLDLREVQLYGKPLNVKVPRHYLENSASYYLGQRPAMRYNRGQQALSGSFTQNGMFASRSNEYPHGFPQPSLPVARYLDFNDPDAAAEGARRAYTTIPPITPSRATKGDAALYTVPSINTTPDTSAANTPKKASKKKHKKKGKTSTPLARESQNDDSGKTTAESQDTSRETGTLASSKRERQELHNRLEAATSELAAFNDHHVTEPTAPRQPNTQDETGTEKPYKAQKRTRTDKQLQASESFTLGSKIKGGGESSQPRGTMPGKRAKAQTPVEQPDVNAGSILKGAEHSLPSSDKQTSPKLEEPKPAVISSERPELVDRTSDSDHADDSFHTANASPTIDKQSQGQSATQSATGKYDSTKSKNAGVKSAATSISPSSKVPIQQTASGKGQADSGLMKNETPRSILQRKVADSSAASTPNADPAESGKATGVATPLPTITKDVEAEDARDREQLLSEKELDGGHSKTKAKSNWTIHAIASDTSKIQTSTTVYQEALTTPASKQTSVPSTSAEKVNSQSKVSAKKGPSQTESFSMFGKKQQKQKKPVKGKGSLKGKPLGSSNTLGLPGDSCKSDVSGTVVHVSPIGVTSSGKKAALNVTTNNGNNTAGDATSKSTSGSNYKESPSGEEITPPASGQDSPSKGGPFGMISALFGRKKSTIASGIEAMPEETAPDNELMDSKAPHEAAQPSFDLDHNLQEQSTTALDNFRATDDSSLPAQLGEDPSNFWEIDNGTEKRAAALEVVPSGSLEVPESPKKKSKKKSKGKKRVGKKAGDVEAQEAGSESQLPADAATERYEVESDTRSSGSSTTMGQPTPPVSPSNLTESNRKRIKARMSESDHIITPRAPRNQHRKKKSNSRNASSMATSSAQEKDNEKGKEQEKEEKGNDATAGLPATAATQTEINQQDRMLRLFQIPPNNSIPLGQEDGARVIYFRGPPTDYNLTFLSQADLQVMDAEEGEAAEDTEEAIGQVAKHAVSADKSTK